MAHARTALFAATALLGAGALTYLGPRTTALAGAAPSFAFAAALVLAGVALAARGARGPAALGWGLVSLAAEAAQHPVVAALLFPAGPASARVHPASYAHRGTFDPLDVVATVLGVGLGALLAVAWARGAPRGARPATRTARATLWAVAAAATLATSPPPGPWVDVVLDPAIACEGETVRATWTGGASGEASPPTRAVLDTTPSDAVTPPVAALEVDVPGALDVVARRSGTWTATPLPDGIAGVAVLLHARPCDARGRAYDEDVAHDVAALAPTPGAPEVVAALRGPAAVDRLVRLDADANETAAADLGGDRTARVRDLAVAPDGTAVAVGWRTRRTSGVIGTEAVLWRWPVGGAVDAGTVLGPAPAEAFGEAAAVAVDANGRAWVAWTEGPRGGTVAVLGRFAPGGTLEATWAFVDTDATEAVALTLDASGRPTLALWRRADASALAEVVVHALDADGAPRWTRGSVGTGAARLASGAGGAVLLLVNGALHALDGGTGATLWQAADPDGRLGTLLSVDGTGAAVVAGPGPFLQRYTLDGEPAGGRAFGSARRDEVTALAWSGGAVVGGWSEGPLASAVDPDRREDAFVLRFPDGAP